MSNNLLVPKTVQKRMRQQHNRCFYCGVVLANVKVEIDHVVPRFSCQHDRVDNLYLTCRECNKAKWRHSVEAFKDILLRTRPDKLIRGLLYCEFIGLYPINRNG